MEMIYPMFAMVALTAMVGLTTGFVRIRSSQTGKVNPKYFRLMANYDVTDQVAQFGRNLNNLFEVPVLFYAAGTCAIALGIPSPTLIPLMWAFVILRIIHTIIHVTYNHPLHRFVPFLISFFCVLAMWIKILLWVNASI